MALKYVNTMYNLEENAAKERSIYLPRHVDDEAGK